MFLAFQVLSSDNVREHPIAVADTAFRDPLVMQPRDMVQSQCSVSLKTGTITISSNGKRGKIHSTSQSVGSGRLATKRRLDSRGAENCQF